MRFRGQGSARQSKFSAVGGLIAGVGIVLTLAGLLITPAAGIVIFIATWVVLLLLTLYQSAANVFGDRGVAHEVSEFSGGTSADLDPETPDFAERLRELQALKDDGFITDAEFSRKRAEILAEKW